MTANRTRSSARRATSRLARLALVFGLAMALACASNVVERDAYDHAETTATLRSHLKGGKPVDRGFVHPVEITEARLLRILSSLRVRVDERFAEPEEKPAVSPIIAKRVARALSESLAKADSSEEVAVLAVKKSRRLGVFSERTLTSFVAYVKDDLLTIALNRVDWNLSNLRTSANNQTRLPKPRLGEKQMDFRVVQSPDYEAAGAQAVAIRFADSRWDDPRMHLPKDDESDEAEPVPVEQVTPELETTTERSGDSIDPGEAP